ncbi:thioredoxin family protein [Saprospiraceae bacterium]|nr:thioredoxin family protein [Saprospiraceae bacterium]
MSATLNAVKLTAKEYQAYFEKAISYKAYQENFQTEMNGEETPFSKYLPQNWSRQSRLDRKLKLREDVQTAVNNIDSSIKWLVITEHWCGDASQINPIINKVAELSKGKIDLRFTYRDENEDLIDAHLTDGRSRSIPILIQFDEEYNVIKTYGPRPEEAQNLVKSILAEGEAYNIPLHTWYAKDKQVSLQDDFVQLLTK